MYKQNPKMISIAPIPGQISACLTPLFNASKKYLSLSKEIKSMKKYNLFLNKVKNDLVNSAS